jgi:Glycosyltransferases involved in cell wall biogenesis
MKISIVIPAFNESNNIEATLNELENYMNDYIGSSGWEIVVVNDGSSDNTVEILNSIKQSKSWLRVKDLVFHYGRGKALRSGLEESSGEIIVSLDADLSYAPYHIERLVEKIEKEDADIVLASAYKRGGTVINVPLKRLWLSKLGNKILSYMVEGDTTVLTCLVRAYKRKFIERLDLHSNDKEIHLEILHKARMVEGNILEVPADLYWRENKLLRVRKGQSKRRSTLKIKKTGSSHLFFALLNKPGFIFWVPGNILILISLFTFAIIFRIILIDIFNGTSIYLAVRSSMLNAIPSWLTATISFVLGIQFLTLGFLTNQNKKNHEETYKTLNAIFVELKKEKK